MKVRDVMTTEVVTISPHVTYEEAARMLHEKRHSGFPVIDEAGTIIGILSEKNLFRGLYPTYDEFMADPQQFVYSEEDREDMILELRNRPVSEFMHKDVVTIHPDAPIIRAGGIMLARNFYRLPVVEAHKLVGLITRDQIFGNILRQQLEF